MSKQDERGRQRGQVLANLLAFAAAQNELGRLFARSRQMHTTDAAAVVEILTAEQHGRPLTPARLAEKIALTTGATSTLLNRLEDAGHIARTREHSDRRVVTLHSTASIHQSADAFFAPLNGELKALTDSYSAVDLALIDAFVNEVRTTLRTYMDAVTSAGTT